MKNILFISSLMILSVACNRVNETDQSVVHHKLESKLDKNQKAWVDKTLSELSIREMAGQVVLEWTAGNYIAIESDDFENEIKVVESGIGGLWLMRGFPFESAAKINELQKNAKIPLFVFGSEGLGSKQYANDSKTSWLRGGGTEMPPAMAYGAIGDRDAIKEAGKIIGLESRAVGVHSTGDPGLNVLMSLKNVLHNRTFGDDPFMVSELASAFIEGTHASGMITSPGFFPGAGSLDIDPHVKLAISRADRQSFDSIHFVPFKGAIKERTDMIMSSHFAIPSLTGFDTLPATLSPEITRILREDLGYNGILITDAMDMGGITNNYEFIEAAILAFKAGNDMILGTSSIRFADTLALLVEKGEIPIKRLKTSVRRILELKARLGLNNDRFVDLKKINSVVGNRTHQLIADSAAARSIVLLRDNYAKVPLDYANSNNVLSITYDLENNESAGVAFNQVLRNHIKSIDEVRISPSSDLNIYQALSKKSQTVNQIIISIYLRPKLGVLEQKKITKSLINFAEDLQINGKDVLVISFGKLEVLKDLPNIDTFIMAWSGQDVMQRAAAKAILGITPISGNLPINLPPFHKRGEGLERNITY